VCNNLLASPVISLQPPRRTQLVKAG
jgi:hypothetical protein